MKASVIIPTYNRAGVVGESIRSALSQTVRQIEVIVVDDGSMDNTRDVVESIGDPRIRYLRQDNGGPASARNRGLAAASGEYVAFLDHDDLWPANFLEVMVKALEDHSGVGLVYSPITVRYTSGRELQGYKIKEGRSGWITRALFKSGFVWTSASVMRRSALSNFGYDEVLRWSYEDGDFFLRLSLRTPFLHIPEVQAIKREHGTNYSSQVGIQPTRILVLERFYYRLGGNKCIGIIEARRRLSHACRSVAKVARAQGKRSQAVFLYQKAISYWPLDIRLHWEFMRAEILRRNRDPEPHWQMPKPLGLPVHSGAMSK